MKLWAINVYYNPGRFATRYRNFLAFRRDLRAPLLTVEWSHDGTFELDSGDSDILIPVRGGDLMWQKERLLNIAVSALPPDCDAVAWLDHDILFEDACWVEQLEAALNDADVVQLFSDVAHLPPEGTGAPLFVRESLVSLWKRCGAAGLGDLIRSNDSTGIGAATDGAAETRERLRLAARPSSGHAWAARRSLLERHGLYDGCICGVGDMAIALAALGQPELFPLSFPLNEAQASHYRAWAEPFAASTGGRVAVLPSRIQHLFHGLLSNRQYRTRLRWASESGFDPGKDLFLDEHGLWKWARNRRLRESWMNAYFERRSEDEQPCPAQPITG